MKAITRAELERLIEKTKSVLLTSNDMVPRTVYPYYHGHPSVPAELEVFKAIITTYRFVSSQIIRKLGQQQMGQVTIDFSSNYFYHMLLGGMVSATFGWGDCGECVSKLASEVILAGCGDLLFVALSLPAAKLGMETTHFLLVTNMKKPPVQLQENTLEALLTCLPNEAIVADPFLGLCFSPKDMPNALKRYLKVYGGQTQVSQAVHLFNFTPKALIDSFFPLMKKVVIATRKKMKNIYSLEGKELAEDQENTLLVRRLSHQTGLAFQAYQSASMETDIVALIKDKTDRQVSIEIMAKFFSFSSEAAVLRQTPEGKPLFVIRNVHETSCAYILKQIIGVEQVALINVDFKWQDNRVVSLEMDDAINRSGFKGYNLLHTGHSGDEAMLRRMMACLKLHYRRVHFIFNDLEEGYWPRSQVQEVIYYENVHDFIVQAKRNPVAVESDILIYGKNTKVSSYLSTRTANEIQAWLVEEGLYIPVVNAFGMIDSADNKFIFSQIMEEGVPLTKLVDIRSLKKDVLSAIQHFSEKVLLKLHNSSQGNGILMLTKDKLLKICGALEQYLSQHKKVIPQLLADELGGYRSRKLEELFEGCRQRPQILLQNYVASDPLEHDGKYYDPTGRAVLLLRRTQCGEQTLEVVDAYWKLPKDSINSTRFDEKACLSCVEGEGDTVTGAAKVTARQLSQIRKAFKLLAVVWINLLGNKTDFYLRKISSVLQLEQGLLTKFFTEQVFDKVTISHLHQFLNLAQKVSGLDSLLIRTLNAELTSFWGLRSVRIETPFFHKTLLHYIASQSCIIDFSKIQYLEKQENQALLVGLSHFRFLEFDENIKLDAHLLLEKLEVEKAFQETQSQFNCCEKKASGYFKREEYSSARAQWQQALGLVKKLRFTQEQEKVSLAKLNNNLGACYRELGEYEEAVQYFVTSLQYQEQGSKNHRKVEAKKLLCEDKLKANQDNKEAVALYKQGGWQAALKLFKRVLAVNEKLFKDKTHLHMASAHWSVSSCYLKLEQPQKAMPHTKRAYEIRSTLLGEEHELTLKAKARHDGLVPKEVGSVFKMGFLPPENHSPRAATASSSNTLTHSS